MKKEISFEEIGDWTESKENGFRKDGVEAFEDIRKRLNDFHISIGLKLEVLEGINIESKKEHERAKILDFIN